MQQVEEKMMVNVIDKKMLDICLQHLGGRRCTWDDESVSEGQILKIITEWREYLEGAKEIKGREDVCLNERQFCCGSYALQLISQKNFVHALHECMNCIDNCGSARKNPRRISLSEYNFYIRITDAFLLALKKQPAQAK